MTTKPKYSEDPVKAILQVLEHVNGMSGQSLYQIFDDWLEVVECTLRMLPSHYKSVQESGQLAEDDTETQKMFEKMKAKYHRDEVWEKFSDALGILMMSTDEFRDVIGDVYMGAYISNKHTGQFFTPWPVAVCMAKMSMMDVETQVHDRIKAKAKEDPALSALIVASLALQTTAEKQEWYWTRVIPYAAQVVDSISVCDPCCGSGVMLLAAANECPRWATDWGFVRFWGMDIDNTCVMMARVNMMLYGLNGSRAPFYKDITPAELNAIPEPYREVYEEAKTATPERVEELKEDLRSMKQMSLF